MTSCTSDNESKMSKFCYVGVVMIFAADVHLEAQSNGEKEVSADMNLCQSASLLSDNSDDLFQSPSSQMC